MIFTFLHFGILIAGLLTSSGSDQQFVNSFVQKNIQSIAQSQTIEYNHSAPSNTVSARKDENMYARELDSLGIVRHSGTKAESEKRENTDENRSLNHCKTLVFRTLKSLPAEAVLHLKSLTLQLTNDGRRGWGGGSTIIIRCQGVTDEELVSVLVHEMGHITDTGLLAGNSASGSSEFLDGSNPVYADDPSLEFYRISFENEKILKKESSLMDFVSGYAATDPFEDFAESYNFYVLHGEEFRHMKEFNQSLQKKYNFLKIRVFKGQEFSYGDPSRRPELFNRDYDTTVIHYDLKKFFVM